MIISLLLLAQGPLVGPETWIRVLRGTAGSVFYIRAKQQHLGPGVHDVWVKEDASQNRTTQFRSAMFKHRVDCDNRLVGFVASTSYYPNGQFQSWGPAASPVMEEPVPETLGEAVVKVVCE